MVKRGMAAVDSPEQSRPKRRRGAAAVQAEEDPAPAQDDGQGHQQADAAKALEIEAALLAEYAAQATAALKAACKQAEEFGQEGEAGAADGGHGQQDEADAADNGADAAAEHGVPDIQLAAVQLAKLTGISLETALNALKETQDQVFSETGGADGGGGGASLLSAWLDEAQVWLACNMEVQAEIENVRTAMQESLQEAEAKKAADDVPLVQRPADYLRDRFLPAAGGCRRAAGAGVPASFVVRHITAFVCHRALFAGGGHKAPFVRLADLERSCHRWYPTTGTVRFWEQVAEECAAAATGAAGETEALKLEGWIGCEQGAAGCATCAAALGMGKGDGSGPSTSAPAPAAGGPPRSAVSEGVGAAVLAAVGDFAARKGPEVEREVCKMPAVSGAVPDVFAALDDPPGDDGGSDVDFIYCVDGGTASARARNTVEELS